MGQKLRWIVLTIALAVRLTASVSAEDWPTYAHDNQRTGVTNENVAPPLKLAWAFEPAFEPAEGWPLNVNGYGTHKSAPNVNYDDAYQVTVSGSVAYFAASGENRVYAVDSKDGVVLWTFATSAAPRLAPTIWNGRAFFGPDDGNASTDMRGGLYRWLWTASRC